MLSARRARWNIMRTGNVQCARQETNRREVYTEVSIDVEMRKHACCAIMPEWNMATSAPRVGELKNGITNHSTQAARQARCGGRRVEMTHATSARVSRCPKCDSSFTWIVHNRIFNDWFSRCGKCRYESIPTRNYDDAWNWKPTAQPPAQSPSPDDGIR